MIDDLSSISSEERCLFRPFTRESLVIVEGRIAEEVRKFKELERKRAEGDVVSIQKIIFPLLVCLFPLFSFQILLFIIFAFPYILPHPIDEENSQEKKKQMN